MINKVFSANLIAFFFLGGWISEGFTQQSTSSFFDTKLINLQTDKTVNKKELDFKIIHRFGSIGTDRGGIHTLFGLEHIQNVRFGFEYGLSDNIQLGFGRSKIKEHLDFNIKTSLLEKTIDSTYRFSLTFFSSFALSPQRNTQNLYARFTDRFSYVHQFIASMAFKERFSLLCSPMVHHRNSILRKTNALNQSEDQNTLFALPVAARYRLNKFWALHAEYVHVFSSYREKNPDFPYHHPVALGFEFFTGGHVFSLNVSNASGITAHDLIPVNFENFWDGGLKFGFTISRTFKF